MSDSSDEEAPARLQVYTLVKFIHRGRKKLIESIDIVPTKWLDFDSRKGRCITKYMQPPYNEEDLKLIQTLTLNNVDAPEDWPVYPVELKGRSETYEEALRKVKRLETEAHVLTLESEDSASEVQRQLTIDVKRKKLLDEAKKLKTKVNVSGDDDSSCLKVNQNTDKNKNPVISKKETVRKAEVVSSKHPYSQVEINDSLFQHEDSSMRHQDSLVQHEDSSIRYQGSSVHHKDASVRHQHSSVQDESSIEHPDKNLVSECLKTVQENPKSCSLGHILSSTENIPVQVNELLTLDPNEPIIEIATIETKTEFQEILSMLTSIMDKQNEMAREIADIKKSQESMSKYLLDNKIVHKAPVSWETKYNLIIPISTYEDFLAFEDKLKLDKYFKNDVYLELRSQMDKDFVVTKSIVNMLKKFMTKDLASKFTAIRSSTIKKDKYKFKPTQFCALIYGTITKVRKEKLLDTDDIDSALTDVMSNVSRWKE